MSTASTSSIHNHNFKYAIVLSIVTLLLLFNSNNILTKATPEFIIVHVTVPSKEVAKTIAQALLYKKLAACVNIMPNILTFYAWKGKINEDSELLLEIKTKAKLFDSLSKTVQTIHPYDVPEVIAIPIERASKPYTAWLEKNTL
jgi:periplasmic divalent cation tolerance protein